MITTVLGLVVGPIAEILKKVIPDADKRAQAQEEITRAVIANEAEIIGAARDVIVAEAQSGSYAARNWRPHLMYFLMALLAWIAVVAPLAGLAKDTTGSLRDVPPEVWQLLMIGMGGYIIGRTGEKIAETFAERMGKR
jgi:hypothetical protein